MSVLYGEELVSSLNAQWTDKWIKAVLDMNGFLSDDSISPENIRILESLMMTIDSRTTEVFLNGFDSVSSSNKENPTNNKREDNLYM
jgi:hypothetical protein